MNRGRGEREEKLLTDHHLIRHCPNGPSPHWALPQQTITSPGIAPMDCHLIGHCPNGLSPHWALPQQTTTSSGIAPTGHHLIKHCPNGLSPHQALLWRTITSFSITWIEWTQWVTPHQRSPQRGDTVPLSPPPCSYLKLIRGLSMGWHCTPISTPLFLPWTHQRSLHGVTLYPYLHPLFLPWTHQRPPSSPPPCFYLELIRGPLKGMTLYPYFHPPCSYLELIRGPLKGVTLYPYPHPLFLPWTHQRSPQRDDTVPLFPPLCSYLELIRAASSVGRSILDWGCQHDGPRLPLVTIHHQRHLPVLQVLYGVQCHLPVSL